MKGKVIFFALSIVPRCDKRIKEFIENGYQVEVFTFDSEDSIVEVEPTYKVNKLGSIPKVSYLKRLFDYTPRIINEIRKYKRDNVFFYFFSLNTAVASLFLPNLKFIYEESDMLFDRTKIGFLRLLFKILNKTVIRKSFITVFTSEGFGKYYYGERVPDNIVYITNRVSSECLDLPFSEKGQIDFERIKFGFVGYPRYITLHNFAKVLVTNFPKYEFHFYGKNNFYSKEQINTLKESGKVYFHGSFKNPNDLPDIYSRLDFIVATYDVRGVNPRYAEPNKIYESIFFRTPIIVSSNSFLADKVEKLKIGFSVDPLDEADIIGRISQISREKYNSYISNLNQIPQAEALNDNSSFFERLKMLPENS